MVSSNLSAEGSPSQAQAQQILQDTAQAVKVMKASWLKVAMNLKKIREHELWRYHNPPANNYEDYVFGVLKLNKYVANRMLQAMDYTQDRRPQLLENFSSGEEEIEIPSFDVVNQLRRAERSFEGHEDKLRELESKVFDEGVGRVVLKREIDEKLAEIHPEGEEVVEDIPKATYKQVIRDLMHLEAALIELKVSKEARKLAFQLVELLQKEERGSASEEEPVDEASDEANDGAQE